MSYQEVRAGNVTQAHPGFGDDNGSTVGSEDDEERLVAVATGVPVTDAPGGTPVGTPVNAGSVVDPTGGARAQLVEETVFLDRNGSASEIRRRSYVGDDGARRRSTAELCAVIGIVCTLLLVVVGFVVAVTVAWPYWAAFVPLFGAWLSLRYRVTQAEFRGITFRNQPVFTLAETNFFIHFVTGAAMVTVLWMLAVGKQV